MKLSNTASNSSYPRIAISGATGRVGAALVASLIDDPVDVLALTRNPRSDRLPSTLATAEIDYDVPDSLAAALAGADRLFLAHGTSDRQVSNEIAMIDAAVKAGITHIVKLSALGPPTKLHPFDWHMKIEAHLAKCDVGYTVLRPSCFVDVLARAKEPVAHGTWGGTAGEGRVNLIDTRDVAAVARTALLDDRFIGVQRAYHLTGPRAVSMPEIAAKLSTLLERPIVYQHRSREAHRKALLASGVSEMVADLLLGLDSIFRENVLAETTNTVTELTGQKGRSPTDWLRENVAGFKPKS